MLPPTTNSKNIPSYAQDSNDFLNTIDNAKNISANCLLVTMDVKSLYTDIPNSEGIPAVNAAYDFSTKSTAKEDFVIYLLKYKKCHIQYVGKAETDFYVRLNNHRKDVYKAYAIPASRHFAMKDHIFNRGTGLNIIQQIGKSTLWRENKKKLLKQRENYWIMKLKTLKPKGLNQELNKYRGQTNAFPSYATSSFVQCILTSQIHRCVRNS